MFPLGTHQREQRSVWPSTSFFQCFSKRGLDIIVSTGGLLLFLPLILLISLVIWIDSGVPILCRQKRYNSNNVAFEIFEFRTTLVETGKKTLNDSIVQTERITRFASILFRSGMSKLPQLLNVLRGEMSIVGSHVFAEAPGNAFPLLDLRSIKPGLVAWTPADDDQRETADTDKCIDRRVDYDRCYVKNCSFFLDAKIIFDAIFFQ